MRFKLDENLDPRLAALLTERGHEADSVTAEGLGGVSDEHLFGKCAEDRRVLITLDLDFADPLRFPPARGAGIMVLRPQRNTLTLIRETLAAALPAHRKRHSRAGGNPRRSPAGRVLSKWPAPTRFSPAHSGN